MYLPDPSGQGGTFQGRKYRAQRYTFTKNITYKPSKLSTITIKEENTFDLMVTSKNGNW